MTNVTAYVRLEKYTFIAEQLTRYVGSCLYIICVFGTVMNILTFFQPKYTRRACSLYLLMASICDFIYLNLGPLSNILQYGFHYDWNISSIGYCQTKTYLVYVSMVISGTLTVLASINQFMLSSKKSSRWRFGCRSMGIRNIKLTILFWMVFSIPIIFCSTRYYHSSNNEQLICSNPCRYFSCRLVQIIYIGLLNGIFPPLIMMIFGFLAYVNVRRLHQRSRSTRTRQINEQLISMLILQSFKFTMASIPYAVFNCYWVKTVTQHRSLAYQTKENFIHQIVYLLFWSNYTSFFAYIYCSNVFRHEWIKMMKRMICCWRRTTRTTSL